MKLTCFVLSQEASQLLTILQGLQPPLKLDGKTIGVDYAKSARKYVSATSSRQPIVSRVWVIERVYTFLFAGTCYCQMGIVSVPFLLPARLSPPLSGPPVRYEPCFKEWNDKRTAGIMNCFCCSASAECRAHVRIQLSTGRLRAVFTGHSTSTWCV